MQKFSNKSKKKGKFVKNNTNKPEVKGKRRGLEEDEIVKLQELYQTLPDPKEIKTFDSLPLSRKTKKGLLENKFRVPTEIQKQALGHALQGKDVLGAAKTGSGKTLAFLIPILENLFLKKWTRMDGTGAIIITPTRELAYQIFESLKKVGIHHEFSTGLIIGGKNLKFEKTRMDQCNIVVCTPGRLLQHMDENPLFNCTSMQILVLDEADRCLDLGFSETMNAIIDNLPPDRQTLLFSATQTKSVKDLARLSLKSPVYVAPHEKSETNTPTSLQQNYVVVEQEEKITMLWSFLKSHLKQKSIVFLSSCKEVKYMCEIFSKLRPGISVLALYGTLHQDRRMAIYDEFCRKSKVVLFATDIASRGLDFPVVSWVIQLDCPEDATAYIHRAGRTARHKANGESLLVLTPNEEIAMVEELKANKIPINKISIDPKRLFSPAVKMEAYLAQSTELKESAQRAFVAYIKSVSMMKNKKIFNAETINFDEYAKSLGLVVTPRVRFLQRMKKRKELQKQQLKRDINKDINSDEEGDRVEGSDEDEDEDELDEEVQNHEKLKTIDLNALMADDDDSDEDAGLMTIKRRDHDIEGELSEVDEEPLEELKANRKNKIVTKASIAKKIIKKKIVANKKIQYDEDGIAVLNTAKQLQSELAREYENADEGGMDIEKAMELMKEEDKYDKQRFKDMVKIRHREQKQKLKNKQAQEKDDDGSGEEDEFESEGEEPDISWLPDYDKINSGKTANSGSDDEDAGSFASYDYSEDEEAIHKPPAKLYSKNKRGNVVDDSDDEIEAPKSKKSKKNIAANLNLDDAEALAMSLLNS